MAFRLLKMNGENPTVHENPEPEEKGHEAQIRKTRFLLAAAVCSVMLAILLFLFSPFFHVREIHVIGNSRISNEEIRARAEVEDGTHLLLFNTSNAANRVMQNRYIADVRFERILPGRLHIYVTERRLTAFVEHMPGSYLYLDENGRVLEVRPYREESLPLLVGLNFTRFQLGEILEVPDPAAFSVIVQYTQLLYLHGLIGRVSFINVSDPANIRIVMYNIEFNVGGIVDADHKVRVIAEVLNTLPNLGMIPGFMDLRVRRNEYFFQKLQ